MPDEPFQKRKDWGIKSVDAAFTKLVPYNVREMQAEHARRKRDGTMAHICCMPSSNYLALITKMSVLSPV